MNADSGRFGKIGLGLDATLVKPSVEVPSPDVIDAYVAHLEQRLGAAGVSAKHVKLLLRMVRRAAKIPTARRGPATPRATPTRTAVDDVFVNRLQSAFAAREVDSKSTPRSM